MAAESFWPGDLFFLLQKKSPYTETINRGLVFLINQTYFKIYKIIYFFHNFFSILRMQKTGLLEKWIETFNPETTECLLKNKKNTVNHRITFKNFTSAFALLLLGVSVSLSLVVFIVELIYRLFRLCFSCTISRP
jgi:hypothetical protein